LQTEKESFVTTPLTDQTRRLIGVLFAADERERAQERLAEGCGDNLPLWLDKTPEGLERIRFAVLKLSAGELDRLDVYIREAQTDWRDVLVAADFADEVQAHTRWNPIGAKKGMRCGGCCGVFLLLLAVFGIWYVDPFAPEFDFERWREENGEHMLLGHYPRRAMADRLYHSDRLIGLSRVETRALLGDPPPEDQYHVMDEEMDVYRIGPERSWPSIDDEWLFVQFDEDDRCEGVLIYSD
jgi:hypothetical protein